MGLFITLEGIEGSGKSTQMELLKRHLEGMGMEVLALREPGGTALGERVRSILLNSSEEPVDPWAELFLYEACRAQLVRRVIRPSLEAGTTVICDRFTDSTLAYQGYGRGLDIEAVSRANLVCAGGLRPDITVLIDCDAEEGLRRAWSRIGSKEGGAREDRFEREDVSFHRRVRDGYLMIAGAEPDRVKVVDGKGEISTIHRQICYIIEKAGA